LELFFAKFLLALLSQLHFFLFKLGGLLALWWPSSTVPLVNHGDVLNAGPLVVLLLLGTKVIDHHEGQLKFWLGLMLILGGRSDLIRSLSTLTRNQLELLQWVLEIWLFLLEISQSIRVNLGEVWILSEASSLSLHLLHGLDVDILDLLLDERLLLVLILRRILLWSYIFLR
jgi:hypothetical protein